MLKLNAAQLRSIIQEAASGGLSTEDAAVELANSHLTIKWVRQTLENAKRDLGAEGEGVEWDEMIEKLKTVEDLAQQVNHARLYNDDEPAQRAPRGSVSRVDALMNNRLGINR